MVGGIPGLGPFWVFSSMLRGLCAVSLLSCRCKARLNISFIFFGGFALVWELGLFGVSRTKTNLLTICFHSWLRLPAIESHMDIYLEMRFCSRKQ